MQECHGVRIEQTERLKADAPMEDKSFCSTSEESSTNRTPVIQWQHALFAPIHSPHSLEKILKISVIFYWSTESSVISFKSNYNMELLLPYQSVKALRWPQVFGDEPIEELMLW